MNIYLMSDSFKKELYENCHSYLPEDYPLTLDSLPDVVKRQVLGEILDNKIESDDCAELHEKMMGITPKQLFVLFGAIYLRQSYPVVVGEVLDLFKEEINDELEAYYEGLRDERI